MDFSAQDIKNRLFQTYKIDFDQAIEAQEQAQTIGADGGCEGEATQLQSEKNDEH